MLGVFHTVRAALPSLVERQGYVLVVSSLAAFAASPGLAAYNASKAGAEHFANALRLEVKHEGVDVGVAHMSLDRHPAGARRQGGPARLPHAARRAALPVQPDHVGRGLRDGVRRRHRRAQAHRLRARLGRARPALRNLINSPIGERQGLKHTPKLLPPMDDEVRRLGRSTSARNVDWASRLRPPAAYFLAASAG